MTHAQQNVNQSLLPLAWSGMLPVEDTALFVTDTGGTGRPVVYLNGSYADQKHWRPVIETLGNANWRHITYDERAHGKSQRSADYSFEGTLRDLDAVLKARNVEKPILVGWSYGAFLALHWADRFPERVAGVVSVDEAMPFGLSGKEGQARIRKIFARFRLLLPIASRFGLAARMSAAEHADINIEINEIAANLGPVLERVKTPVRYVLATGSNLGSSQEEMEQVRASLSPYLALNPHLQVSAKVPANHGNILKKEYRSVAQAVREVTGVPLP